MGFVSFLAQILRLKYKCKEMESDSTLTLLLSHRVELVFTFFSQQAEIHLLDKSYTLPPCDLTPAIFFYSFTKYSAAEFVSNHL